MKAVKIFKNILIIFSECQDQIMHLENVSSPPTNQPTNTETGNALDIVSSNSMEANNSVDQTEEGHVSEGSPTDWNVSQ